MSDNMPNLTHYLRMACQEAGVQWSWENDGELATIADEVRAIVRAEMADEIRDLRLRIAAVEQLATGVRP